MGKLYLTEPVIPIFKRHQAMTNLYRDRLFFECESGVPYVRYLSPALYEWLWPHAQEYLMENRGVIVYITGNFRVASDFKIHCENSLNSQESILCKVDLYPKDYADGIHNTFQFFISEVGFIDLVKGNV